MVTFLQSNQNDAFWSEIAIALWPTKRPLSQHLPPRNLPVGYRPKATAGSHFLTFIPGGFLPDRYWVAERGSGHSGGCCYILPQRAVTAVTRAHTPKAASGHFADRLKCLPYRLRSSRQAKLLNVTPMHPVPSTGRIVSCKRMALIGSLRSGMRPRRHRRAPPISSGSDSASPLPAHSCSRMSASRRRGCG